MIGFVVPVVLLNFASHIIHLFVGPMDPVTRSMVMDPARSVDHRLPAGRFPAEPQHCTVSPPPYWRPACHQLCLRALRAGFFLSYQT